jgi:hypothetical protein
MAKEGGGSHWVTIIVAALGAAGAIGAAFIARGPATSAPQTLVAAQTTGAPTAPQIAPAATTVSQTVDTAATTTPATTPASAAPSTDWRQQVLGFLDTQHKPLADAGYARDNGTEDWVGLLKVGTPKVWEVQLVRGVDYQVVGVCDSDCKNVDMEVFDMSGASIGADTLVDDFPRAQFRPGQSGPHTVKVWLRDCNSADGTQQCMVAARLLRR